MSVRVERESKKRLGKLAKSTGRSQAYLAAQAIDEYLDINEWQISRIKQAMTSLTKGKGVTHTKVKQWVMSWGARREARVPRAA